MSIFKIVLVALVSICCFINSAFADSQGIYFAPEVGYVLPTDGDVDDTVFVGAKLGLELDQSWALELESGWYETPYDVENGPQNVDITTVPILLNLRYNLTRCEDDKLGWYVFGGGGASINDVDEDEAPFDVEVDDSVAWQLGAGVEVPLSENTDAFLDVRYVWNEPDFSVAGVDNSAVDVDDLKLQSVMFLAGVKF